MHTFGEVIKSVIGRVFEDWAMMLVELDLEPAPDLVCGNECMVVEVDFQGVVSGRYLVFAPKEFLSTLAVNVLGLDAPPQWSECEDAYREMGNVLSGNLLTEMFGEDTVFDISLPVVRPCTPEDRFHLDDHAIRTFYVNADDQVVAVSFWARGVGDDD